MLYPEIKRSSWTLTILYGLAFIVLSALVGSGALAEADRSLAFSTKDFSWTPFLYPFSALSSFFVAGLIIILIYKKISPRIAWRFLLALAFASSVELLFKIFLSQPAGIKEHGIFFLQLENAFPSGHMIRATLFAGGIYLLSGWRAIWIIPLFPAITMLGFDYHWSSDLLGGFLLAMFSLYLLAILPRKERVAKRHKENRPEETEKDVRKDSRSDQIKSDT